MRITDSILTMILVTTRYENQSLPLNYMLNIAVSVTFDSRKHRQN